MIRKISLFWLLVLVFISVISLVKAQANYTVPYVDPEILVELNKTSQISIIVELYGKNMSKVDEVLSTLSESEFKLKRKLPWGNGFGGNITKQGFDKLLNNSDIKIIWLNKPVHTTNEDERIEDGKHNLTKNDTISKNFSIFEEGKKSEIPNEASEVEKIKPLERKTKAWLLASIFVFTSFVSIYLLIKFRKR